MIAEKTAEIIDKVGKVENEAILDAITDLLDSYLKLQDLVDPETDDAILGIRPDGTELRVDDAKVLFAEQVDEIRDGNALNISELKEQRQTW